VQARLVPVTRRSARDAPASRPRYDPWVEVFLDRSSPLAWAAALVLLASGAAAVWIGVRDGFVRRRVRASSGVMTGGRAIATGVLYVATGLAGVWGALAFAFG
jgi:hypothetical protein